MSLQHFKTFLGITDQHTQKFERKDYDLIYLDMANELANASHDFNTKIGCIAVKNNRIIAAGLNGFPPGSNDHLLPNRRVNDDDLKLNCMNHAEENMIFDAARRGISLEGSTIYITAKPCKNCAKALVSVGIRKWVLGRKQFKESELDAAWREFWIKMFNVEIKYV